MHRDDKMLLASQYGRRQLRSGVEPVQAARVAAELYGLTAGAEKTLRVRLESEKKETVA